MVENDYQMHVFGTLAKKKIIYIDCLIFAWIASLSSMTIRLILITFVTIIFDIVLFLYLAWPDWQLVYWFFVKSNIIGACLFIKFNHCYDMIMNIKRKTNCYNNVQKWEACDRIKRERKYCQLSKWQQK